MNNKDLNIRAALSSGFIRTGANLILAFLIGVGVHTLLSTANIKSPSITMVVLVAFFVWLLLFSQKR